MIFYEWARRWGVPLEALQELQNSIGVFPTNRTKIKTAHSEAAVLNQVKLKASENGARLWRNNVGATYTQNGNFIRYGLANESAAMNKVFKSADLIGIKPILITPSMVGLVVGQFISREIKSAAWRYTGTECELAQLKWAELILLMGGDAALTSGL